MSTTRYPDLQTGDYVLLPTNETTDHGERVGAMYRLERVDERVDERTEETS